jgi:hypothetical protein
MIRINLKRIDDRLGSMIGKKEESKDDLRSSENVIYMNTKEPEFFKLIYEQSIAKYEEDLNENFKKLELQSTEERDSYRKPRITEVNIFLGDIDP